MGTRVLAWLKLHSAFVGLFCLGVLVTMIGLIAGRSRTMGLWMWLESLWVQHDTARAVDAQARALDLDAERTQLLRASVDLAERRIAVDGAQIDLDKHRREEAARIQGLDAQGVADAFNDIRDAHYQLDDTSPGGA